MKHKTYKTDANQPELVRQLRRVPDVSVKNTAMVGDGFVDIVVGRRVSIRWLENTFGVLVPFNFLLEIKDGSLRQSARQLTKDERDFHDDWTGQIDIVSSLGETLRTVGAIR